ncbi:hypothetical protein F5Y18DRAFT_410253 [Xylariaceae sp. FL1019]|nr:hypothetical protein F5Y18DRAFT_410253 [Xylariaceae sp. FL1019]
MVEKMPAFYRHYPSQWLTIFAILSLALTALAMTPELSGRTAASKSTILRREMTPYSSCSGSEGQWNCMTDSFQRCGSGQWSVTQQCAAGTQCSPSGLTYEFHVDFANGYNGAAPPTSSAPPAAGTGATERAAAGLSWWLMGILVTSVVLVWI